jgi:hypothetical protein
MVGKNENDDTKKIPTPELLKQGVSNRRVWISIDGRVNLG